MESALAEKSVTLILRSGLSPSEATGGGGIVSGGVVML